MTTAVYSRNGYALGTHQVGKPPRNVDNSFGIPAFSSQPKIWWFHECPSRITALSPFTGTYT